MSAMSRVHREVLARVPGGARPVFLDTTAGYETNVDAIVQKAVEYYRHYLQQDLRVASYRHCETETPARTAAAIAELRRANLVFSGPGSPTYAIRHWRNSPVWDEVIALFDREGDVLFASAASISLGAYSVPVYEIFKVGQDPHWVEGLDLFGRLGLKLAIVPHFDDTSGGENFDSRFCYLGAARFDAMQSLLPPDVTIVGIDAYTAVTFDHHSQEAKVLGQSGITLIGDGESRRFESGSVIPFQSFQSTDRGAVSTFRPEGRGFGYEFTDGPANDGGSAVEQLGDTIGALPSLSTEDRLELMSRLESLKHHIQPQSSNEDALVDLLVELRTDLRKQRQFALADRARDALAELGVDVADSPEGSTWSRRG
jgi:hypothetical protein